MKRYMMTFGYDATNYHGYQKQPGLVTIQSTIEESLLHINSNEKVVLQATGRTDKGVHALKQKAHFDLAVTITPLKLKMALNSTLPEDIYVSNVEEVDKNFHARYMATKKEYLYILNMGEYNPIERNHIYQHCKMLDIEKMCEAIQHFVGIHDFTSFISAEDLKEDKVREIFEVSLKVDEEKVYFDFIGNGFLKYQVRNMVGTLIEIGSGKRDPSDIEKIINAKDRKQAGMTAKPEGLYLVDIWF